ncbi:MAG: hypothetical protein ACKO9I_19495, partial [Sphaerospermopsis kisseleviana]
FCLGSVVGFVCLTSFNIADLSGNVNYFFKNFLDFLANGLKALLEQGLVLLGLPLFVQRGGERVGFCDLFEFLKW